MRDPRAVRALTWLLVATAAATVVVEVLNFRYASEHGYGFAVRTGWALLRTLGWLLLIRHVRRGRAGARAFGLILAVTTIFAVGRLVVPRTGTPPLPGVLGFAVLAALCVTVVALLYRHPAVRAHLVTYPRRLVVTRQGIEFRSAPPKRPPITGWVLTARVSAFTYSPLMLVPCLVGFGVLGRHPEYLLAVLFWLAAGIAASYAVLLSTIFLIRGRPVGRRLLIWVSVAVLVVDLPLCLLVLGVDGLVRDGTPLVAAVALTFWSLWRAARTPAAETAVPA